MDVENKNKKDYKRDFSVFSNFYDEYKKPLIYLDTAASSLTPDCVVSKMNQYYTRYRSNIDRSDFVLSCKATEEYEKSRDLVSGFVGAQRTEVFFTSGATDASNKLMDMWVDFLRLKKGDTIAVSVLEHHAVIVPIMEKLSKLGIIVLYIKINLNYKIDLNSYKNILEQKPKLVFLQHASNITGTVQDIKNLTALAHEYGSYLVCDGSQAVGHIQVNVKDLDVDSYFWSSHKMCGPVGVGAVYIPENIIANLNPSVYGGGIVTKVNEAEVEYREDIKRFEPGTQNIAGVIGFGASVEYLENIGLVEVEYNIKNLNHYLVKQLSLVPSVTLYAELNGTNTGIVSFAIEGLHAHDITYLLGVSGIALRGGYHCSEPFVREISKVPLVRASLYFYNTFEDIDIFIKRLKEISLRLA